MRLEEVLEPRGRLVLDEGIVRLAIAGQNEADEDDDTCLATLREAFVICHSIAITPDTWGRYGRHAKRLQESGRPINGGVIPLLGDFLRTAEKEQLVLSDEELLKLPSLDDIVKPMDRVWVRLAATIGERLGHALLVTTDRPLIDAVLGSPLADDYSIVAVHPKPLLELLT